MTTTPPEVPLSSDAAAPLPLLPAQRGMLAGHLADPSSSSWSVALLTCLDGPVDLPTLTEAVLETTAEMASLRLRLDTSVDPARQRVQDTHDGTVVVLDRRADMTQAARLAESMADLPWDLEADSPLVTHTLIPTDSGVAWLQRGLHAVVDGYGGWLMRHRIVERYNALVDGRPAAPATFPTMAEVVQGCALDEEGPGYYRDYLAGAPERLSPAERALPVQDHPHRHEVPLAEDVRQRLGATLGNRVWTYPLIAATAAYCARLCEEREGVIGMPVLGRSTAAERATTVQMMTVLPLRVTVGEGESLREVTDRAVRDAKAARRFGKVQAQDIFQAIPGAWKAGRVHGPVVNVMPYDEEPVMPGVGVSTRALQRGPVYDLLFTVHPSPNGTFVIEGLAHPGLYTAEEARWLTERLATYLDRVSTPGAVVADVDHRLPGEIDAATSLRAPRVTSTPAGPAPAWGEHLDVDRLQVAGLAPEEPRGFEVRDRLGYPCGWHQVGELVALAHDGEHMTGLLVSAEPDGSLTCRGTVEQRRQIRGRHIETGAVESSMGALPSVSQAQVRWQDDRLVADIVVAADTDDGLVKEQVRRCAPAGSRLRVAITREAA